MLSLREVRGIKQAGSGSTVKVGDIVILKDERVKRLFWKLAKVIQLLEGSDRIARAALINVSNEGGPPRILKQSTCHLTPIEVNCKEDEANVPPMVVSNENSCNPSKYKETVDDTSNGSAHSPINLSRPRRQAAILGEQTRRTWTGH